MKEIVYDSPRTFSYRDVAEPAIEDDEVLIRVRACGMCGTDLHIHEGASATGWWPTAAAPACTASEVRKLPSEK